MEYEKPPPYSPAAQPIMNENYPGPHGHPHGHPHGPQQGFSQPYSTYGATMTVPLTTQVIVVGGCPACRIGVLEDDFSCLGILCAIFFFPIGILCCLAMRQRRCPNCGAIFG